MALLGHLQSAGWPVRQLDTQKRRVPVASRGRWSIHNLAYALWDAARLLRELVLHRPAVLHTPFASTLTGALRDAAFIAMARLFGVRVVAHVHGGDFDRLLRDGPWPAGLFCSAALHAASRVIVLSQYWQKLIEASFAGLKCTVVPNGSEDLGQPRAPTVRPPSRILHVGAQGRRKGVPELLAALALLRERGLEARLILVGDEEWTGEGARIDAQIDRLGLADWVEGTGHLEGSARLPHFSTADVFCLPSHHEGAPVALLEAMSAGLPVVVSAVGAMPEIVRGGGIVVPPGDVQALADALQTLLDDPDLCRCWGQRNRQEWEREYQMVRHLERVEELIEAVGRGS